MTNSTGDYSPDQLDALWVQYQTQGVATCPVCNTALEVELGKNPVPEEGATPHVKVRCPGCGRQGENVAS